MLAPSVPTDKNKQGGRNYDASKLTDFKKIAVIDGVTDSKLPLQNNKNIYTNTDEQRRAAVLYSSLRAVPRFKCSTCPLPAYNINTQTLSGNTISALSNVTFFVMYSTSNSLYYANYKLYTDSGLTTELTNSTLNTSYSAQRVSPQTANNIGTITVATREGVVSQLNTVLSPLTWNSGSSYLKASVNSSGRLVLEIVGTQITGTNTPPHFAGLFFGNASNGSTSLGVTNKNGVSGVAAAALVITQGQTSVTAPFIIADPAAGF